MSNDSERRRSKRVRLPDSHGSLVVSLDGTVLDISLSGLAVETHTRLSPQRRLSLRLGDGTRTLRLDGHVVWCFLHGTRAGSDGEQLPVYRAGVQFEDVLSLQARELVDFLEQHAIVTLETRLFGRFRIAETDAVEVSSAAEFRVVELDAEGLTVETTLGLEPRSGCEVELQLDGSTLTAPTSVVEARRIEGGDGSWRLRLRFLELDERSREMVQGFLRGALGDEPPASE
ncbi:MAG: hypothetical protein AMXMBFR36_28340 [Acidobacteriota bacterium]